MQPLASASVGIVFVFMVVNMGVSAPGVSSISEEQGNDFKNEVKVGHCTLGVPEAAAHLDLLD